MVADPGDDVVLVLVHAGGVKGKSLLDAVKKAGAVVVECKPVKWESDKVAFVQGEFKAAGRRVAPAAAVALVDALGSDLRELAQRVQPAGRPTRRARSTSRSWSATTRAGSR